MKQYQCDECDMIVNKDQREEYGTQFRHTCGGRWVQLIKDIEVDHVAITKDGMALGGKVVNEDERK